MGNGQFRLKLPAAAAFGYLGHLIYPGRHYMKHPRQARTTLQPREDPYGTLFEQSPIAIWEEDFSAVKTRFDHLRATGIQDFRRFFRQHPEEVQLCAAIVKIRQMNEEGLRIFGVSRKEEIAPNLSHYFEEGSWQVFGEEEIAPNLSHYFEEGSWQVFGEELIALAAGKSQFESVIPIRGLQGARRIFFLKLIVPADFLGTLGRVLISFTDVTNERRAEEDLRRSEERARALVEESTIMAEQEKIVPPLQEKYIRLDKKTIDVEVIGAQNLYRGEPVIVVMGRDITEQKEAEKERAALREQVHQAQKMEAIGTLAGGIAHDFNNILMAISGFAELANLDVAEGSKAKYNLQQSMKATHRAKDLVQQILSFTRQGKQERKPLNIQPIVKEALKFLRASLPTTIEIRQDMEENLGTIEADPTEVYQVLMNLCTNAAHAMEEKGGVLEVSLSQVDIPGEAPAASRGIEPGPYLRLRVSDTGHGMPPEILKKIFDPYFTTKEVGKGTGLGLAVVHGIVKSYGGEISISSEVGKGSTFDIYFPRIQALGRPSEAEKAEPLPFGGHERVLFVDDEKTIAEIGESMLKYLGYAVEVRTSSIDALELFRAQADRFDLVITDMTMPNMTGDKLAQELLRIRPGIPIILCTGFSEYLTEEKAKALGIQELVMKPLAMKDLAAVIRRALDRKKKKQR